MSVKAVAWALEQEIDDPISHLLLVNLADCTDNKSTCCWPGQDFLAKRIRRSTDTVQRHLKKLVKSGHITVEYRADENGHSTSNLYRLNVDVAVGVEPPTSNVSQAPKPHPCGLGKDRLNRKSTSPKPQTGGVLNRTMDAVGTEGTEGTNNPLPPCRGPTPSDALRAFEQFNEVALKLGLPQASKLTPDRQRKIIARLRDYGLEGWDRALQNLARSKFLTGRNDRNFRADLDFICQAKSFGKLHDGGYSDDPPRRTAPAAPVRASIVPDWIEEARKAINA
jgi:DNA-binding Lrp family transcriptional regulator